MHHALSTFLDNPTAATFNKLNAARIKTLKQHREPPAQPKPLTDKLSTFSESLKDMIKHVEEKDCRELNDLTISGSFDVFLNDSELDDLCLRIFTKHYIDIVVNHDRKTLTVVFEDSIDNYDTMKRINRLELITDKIASTLTKSGNFNKATLKQAAKALAETKISAPRY